MMKLSSDNSTSDSRNNFQMSIPKEEERNAWGPLSDSNAYHHVSSDATLFSSSLPVLPHEKLKLSDMEEMMDEIGNMLPDDEDKLLADIIDDLDLNGLPGSLEDLDEYDLFGSGGGLELDSEPRDSFNMGMTQISLPDFSVSNTIPHYGLQNGVGTVVGEHPYGEHPSRTLFVRNINSNIEDSELRALFEDYGDIRTLYTACKHRGFVMISYYDIRSARMAMRALQNKPLRRRKLDIHFSIPKDNPSEKDINQGTLVVFNLDQSVSNEDVHQIFGAYGEIKEIRETPHKRHHKFIEFYDVRAAEAALKALNKCEIAGKRIKIEPSRPGGARRNLMLQLNQEFEQDDSHGYRHQVGSPIINSPPGTWLNSPMEHSPFHKLGKSPACSIIRPTTTSHLPGLASVLNSQAPNSKLAPIGKNQGRFGHVGHHEFQQSHSFPEPKLGQYAGTNPSFGSSKLKGGSIEMLSGSEFLWGSPNSRSEVSSSSIWSTSPLGNPYLSNSKDHGFTYSARQDSLFTSPHHDHNHHNNVGSAPSGIIPLERHFGFFPESSRESPIMNPTGFRGSFLTNMGSSGITNQGNMFENGFCRMMSSPRLSPVFLNNSCYSGLVTSNIEALSERGRTHQAENNVNQADSRKQFQLDLGKIITGEDTRTTLMIKNIPNKYTSKMLLAAIDEKNKGTYDFIYLPIDFKNKCNVGYAFINMLSPEHIIPLYEAFNGKKWEKFNSEKVASLAYARIQGKAALIAHFQNSSLMNEDKRCRPILFHQNNGSDTGDQEHLQSGNTDTEVSVSGWYC